MDNNFKPKQNFWGFCDNHPYITWFIVADLCTLALGLAKVIRPSKTITHTHTTTKHNVNVKDETVIDEDPEENEEENKTE